MAALQKRSIDVIRANQAELAKEWQDGLATGGAGPRDISAEDLSRQTTEFLCLLLAGAAEGDTTNLADGDWREVRNFLEKLSRSRAQLGFDPQHTINFIFSLKRSVFGLLQREFGKDPAFLADQLWVVSELIDAFGMHTMRTFQKSREEVITRQQEELLELSTPVVKLWDGVLALPMIGTLDSRRTQTVMESLLQRIVDTGSEIAIIDITGVPTVDTLVAQHLLKTVTAIRLMGADCIISGVRPQIAQTIVHLGLDLEGIVTKANLSDALALALRRRGLTVTAAAAA